MKLSLWFIGLCLCVLCASPCLAAGYRCEGSSDPVLPTDALMVESWPLLLPGDSIYSLVIACQGEESWSIFIKEASAESNPPEWAAIVKLDIPAPGPDELISTKCMVDGTRDIYVVAIVKRTNTPEFHDVKSAWRFDPDYGEMDPIPLTGIACVNSDYEPPAGAGQKPAEPAAAIEQGSPDQPPAEAGAAAQPPAPEEESGAPPPAEPAP